MEIIRKHFPGLSSRQAEQFGALESLYKEWNSKINVISRKDSDNLYERHVLHSLSIAAVISFVPGTKILDVGTGGGFPGIPLAIFFPDCEFLLIDSIWKKIKVVNEVSTALGLTNVTTRQARVEEIRERFDFVVSRAVTTLPQFSSWAAPRLLRENKNPLPNGILYLKGGEIDDEIKATAMNYRVYEISRFFKTEFFETKKLIHLWPKR